MPELAEVEYMRRRWNVAIGQTITAVEPNARARVLRGCDVAVMRRALDGARLTASARSGKQMIFRFGSAGWLGLHLGMTGELRVAPPAFVAARHDHLVLRQKKRALVFSDPRMFGAISFTPGREPPAWWRDRPPDILVAGFTRARLAAFLRRRARAPVKAALLMQEMFPGIGNWMADEVLWRAGIHPARLSGKLGPREIAVLFRALRFVCRGALRTIAVGDPSGWGDPPPGWLFHVRWSEGGRCPKTGLLLERATIGGRTTCWSPARQKLKSSRSDGSAPTKRSRPRPA
jgi:formamidopyrimidine-DNA glycosylase